ncbi:SSI family serine proteinase inhibitor [Streptomyces sp. NPDC088358]|uniref:SSI family serine proteinase inhibitor n=1 Tax=Streptomyces sp. NPDC088358 TaxID=3365857 RepID=UPI0038205793
MTRTTEALRGALLAAAALLTAAAAQAPTPARATIAASAPAPASTPALISASVPTPAAASVRDPVPGPSHRAVPGNWLHLTITRGEASPQALPPLRAPVGAPVRAPAGARLRAETTPGTDTRGTLLFCDPPQGHPHAAQACAELTAVGGDIGRIPVTPGVLCPMIYAPVTVAARGEWDGRPVTYAHTFANSCVMGAATGAVFALGEWLE